MGIAFPKPWKRHELKNGRSVFQSTVGFYTTSVGDGDEGAWGWAISDPTNRILDSGFETTATAAVERVEWRLQLILKAVRDQLSESILFLDDCTESQLRAAMSAKEDTAKPTET